MSLFRTLGKAAIGRGIQKRTGAGGGLLGLGLGLVATRIATRSIPGALLVGGAFIAKKIYDKRKTENETDLALPNEADETVPPVQPQPAE